MAEKSSKELLIELINAFSAWVDHGQKPTADTKFRRRYDDARAAVLARMAGTGEVVVPVKQIEEWRLAVTSWASYASDYFKDKWDLRSDLASFDPYLAARPNNGGTNDQGK